MSRTSFILKLARQASQLTTNTRFNPLSATYYSTMLQTKADSSDSPNNRIQIYNPTPKTALQIGENKIGDNVSRRNKIILLVKILMDLEDSKKAVYSTLDAWVASECDFPIGPLKNVLLQLEEQNQWHRVIQVIKWMLSKGQGTTNGTYGQLIVALDMDHRVEEADMIWKKKLGYAMHSVPWKLCKLMISVYYRNKMFEDVVKLFSRLESFGRKPPEKSIVQRVADAYEILGRIEDKEKILDKYKDLFVQRGSGKPRRHGGSASPKKTKPKQKTT